MRIICDERPKDSSECILNNIFVAKEKECVDVEDNRYVECMCDGNCKECKYIETIEEHEHYKYDDGYDD